MDEQDAVTPKKKRFRLFDTQREGKGIKKEDVLKLKPNLRGFFTYLRRDFSRIISVNMFLVVGNFPLLFALLAFSGVGTVAYTTPLGSMFSTLYGVTSAEGIDAASVSLLTALGTQVTEHAPTLTTYVLYALSALVLLTFGLVSVGTTYVVRNMLMGEPVFIWSDFIYAIKRNIKQGIIVGILDLLFSFLLVADALILLSSNSMFGGLLVGAIFVFLILYIFMRPYIYIQIVTFDLTLFKIFKNALIFSLLGLKRNVMALLGALLAVVLCIFMLFGFYGILVPVGLAAAVALLFGLIGYMFMYAAYFKVKVIMIDPYVEKEDLPDEKPILTDHE